MESKIYLQKAISTIENNIAEKINIEQLSTECFVSPRQFYRDFYSMTGHSVNEYIGKRRLSKALSLLKYSDMKAADIAYLCGYSSQQAFCKAVKTVLSATPNEYRTNNDIYYFPSYAKRYVNQIAVNSITIPKMISMSFYSSNIGGIEDKAVYYFLSVIPAYSQKIFGRDGKQQGDKFCYKLYIEYDEKYLPLLKKSDFNKVLIQPEYSSVIAHTTVKNKKEDINKAWDFLYSDWLKNSMFELDEIPYFEEYIIRNNVIKRLILYLPVKFNKNLYKIKIHSFGERLFVVASHDSETTASIIVTDFIAQNHAYLFKSQKEYYVSTQDICTCGISIEKPVYLPNDESLRLLYIPSGIYAVLEGSCYGSGKAYEQQLLQWVSENGFEIEGNSFSVYDITNGANKNEIIVKSQVKIKYDRIV